MRLTGILLVSLLGMFVACADDGSPVLSGTRSTGGANGRSGSSLSSLTASARGSTPKPRLGALDRPDFLPVVASSSVRLGERAQVTLVPVQARVTWMGQTREQYFRSMDLDNQMVILVPQDSLVKPRQAMIDSQGNAYFPEVEPGVYHLVFKVNYNTFGSGQANSSLIAFPNLNVHDQAANRFAYWCRPVFILDGYSTPTVDTFDLFWDNGAIPRNPGPHTTPGPRREIVFRASVDPVSFGPLVSGNRSFTYSVVISSPLEPMTAIWFSPWKSPENGKVEIPWNGYVLDPAHASGIIRRMIDPKEAGAIRLPAGEYLYAIQFRETFGSKGGTGLGFPEMLGLFAADVAGIPQDDGLRQGELFQGVEFGQTLFSQFTLEPAPLSTDSATTSSSPTP